MNENKFNQNFNNQPNNNQPTQPVKNRFFNFDFDTNENDVGSKVENNVSNVISWGVGRPNNSEFVSADLFTPKKEEPIPEALDESSLMTQVNSDYYNGESLEVLEEFNPNNQNNNFNQANNYPEVLDEELPKLNENYLNAMTNKTQAPENNQNNMGNNFYGTNQQSQLVSPILTEAINSTPISGPIGTPSQIGDEVNNTSQAPESSHWKDGIGTTNPEGTAWMNNQPLSAAALGVSSSNQENTPKDVVEASRFFNTNINSNNQEEKQNIVNTVQYGNGVGVVLDDPIPTYDEMALLKEFIGPNFTKLSMSIFSFSTLLFGSLVYLHRKMYLLGIIFAIIESSIASFIPLNFACIMLLIVHIILALAINPLYIKHAKKSIKKIVVDKKNHKKNQVELNAYAHKKGKHNLFLAIIIYMIISGLIYSVSSITDISSYLIKGYHGVVDKVKDLTNNSNNEEKEEQAFKVENYINITIPSEFTKKEEFEYIFNTDPNHENTSCYLKVEKIDSPNSAEEYLESIREKLDIKENIGLTNSNGITWSTVTNNTDEGKTYYRISKIKDVTLLLEYKIDSSSDNLLCERKYSEIIHSISPIE